MTAILHSLSRDSISMNDALAAVDVGTGGLAMLYSPTALVLARREHDGEWRTSEGASLDDHDGFELRAFGDRAELRWLDGQAVLLAEDARSGPLEWSCLDEIHAVERMRQTYLLWGSTTGASDGGWLELAEARVGAVSVPVAASPPERARVQLVAYEYVVVGDHGNAAVVEERLAELRIAPPQQRNRELRGSSA